MWLDTILGRPMEAANDIVIGGESLGMIGTCLFCWWRGAAPDRIAAFVFAICWMGYLTSFQIWTSISGDPRQQALLTATWDVIPGVTFLYLAIRHNNLWFGAAAMAQGVQLALDALDHSIREPFGTTIPIVLILGMNLMNLIMMIAMVGSANSVAARRRGLVQSPA